MANEEQAEFKCYFQSWMVQQEQDLQQLIQALDQDTNDKEKLLLVIQTNVRHYEEYHKKRLLHSPSKPSSFFSPTWCSSLEKPYLWAAGCRPSLFIRLVYTLCGSHIELQIQEFLQGLRTENLGELSAEQLGLIDSLHRRTIQNEEDLSSKLASIQEEIAEKRIVEMARHEWGQHGDLDPNNPVAFQLLDSLELVWVGILEEADVMRLGTLKQIVDILTPVQAVEFLIFSRKLHLWMHKWSNRREHQVATE